MKIKGLFAAVIMAALVLLSGCSDKGYEMTEEDKQLHQKLMGVWCHIDSVVTDSDGNYTSFSAYEFTECISKAHDVDGSEIRSILIAKYAIKNGEYVVEVDGKEEYAMIEIREVDGRDHLFWGTDTETTEFFRMTDEEIEAYALPVGQMLSGEAEMLGIETEATSETSATEALSSGE